MSRDPIWDADPVSGVLPNNNRQDRVRADVADYNAAASVLGLCLKALKSLPQGALGRDPEGWFYRDELIANVEKVLTPPPTVIEEQEDLG